MNEENKGTETKVETIPTPVVEKTEAELKIEALEQEKAKLIEEKSNYQVAYLKEKRKNKDSDEPEEETEEQRLRRIVREETANTRITQIDKEKEDLLQRTLRENRELKLAHLNKTPVSTAVTSSTEEPVRVSDTSVTPDQITALKARGWTDKDIERYKKNLVRYKV